MSPSATKHKPSKTADLTAAIRALHVRQFSPPVFNDSLAFTFCTPFWKAVVSTPLLTRIVVDGILGKMSPISPEVVVRGQWCEDIVEIAVAQGIDQFVILGAGYDTLALRRPDLVANASLWELDQAATQREKLRRMEKHGLAKPANTHYVEADLEVEKLDAALEAAGMDLKRPALFVWLGVTYYLTMDAITQTLNLISSRMAPGTVILFDYMADEESTNPKWRELRTGCAAFVAKRGEPWISFFKPKELDGFVQTCGYSEVVNMEPDQISPHYLQKHSEIVFPEIMGFAKATV